MLEISFDHNVDAKIIVFDRLKVESLPAARRSALSSVGYYVSKEIRAYIETGGKGTWSKAHPMTQLFEKNGGKWERRSGFQSPYHGLGKFTRYLINTNATEAKTGFGTFNSKSMKKGKVAKFSSDLQDLASAAQRFRTFGVTPKMRRLLGATKKSAGSKPGVNFFPLRRETTSLTVPARPIMVPVFAQVKGPAATLFAEKFKIALEKRYEKL